MRHDGRVLLTEANLRRLCDVEAPKINFEKANRAARFVHRAARFSADSAPCECSLPLLDCQAEAATSEHTGSS